ncbi:MAG: hypothetical protein EBZ74_09525 [Planctomycetia bacterium]|nr:hypothetical protein [Planctomycetia bacterium]
MTSSLASATLWIGILAGLVSAACMSLAYLLSRHHVLARAVDSRQDAALGLLLRAHVVMGLVAIPAAGLVLPPALPGPARLVGPLVGAAGPYLAGNLILFGLLRRFEASRLTPFLGLKVFLLALVAAMFLGQSLAPRQWLGVGLSVAATAVLQGTAGGLPPVVLVRVLAVCGCFAASDLAIVRLIDVIAPPGAAAAGRMAAAVLGMLLTYAACGLGCAAALLVRRSQRAAEGGADWRVAAAYAATWLVAMAALYICFGLVGAVLGNVVQSTRGVMSIVFGAALAHLGWHELEQRVDRATLVRRIAAAALMTAAIGVYVVG